MTLQFGYTDPEKVKKTMRAFEKMKFTKYKWNQKMILFEIEDIMNHLRHELLKNEEEPTEKAETETDEYKKEKQNFKQKAESLYKNFIGVKE